MRKKATPSPAERLPFPGGPIARRIFLIRSHNVMLSADLAELYQVETKALNQAVKRNLDRFPADFMFQLSKEEFGNLKSQTVTLEKGRGRHPKYQPYAFTQEGVAMLSSVLRNPHAVQVNIGIMRAFVQLRQLAESHKDLAEKIAAMEKKYDVQFRVVFDAIKKLLAPPATPKRRIGFTPEKG
jgi:hypothetical protein